MADFNRIGKVERVLVHHDLVFDLRTLATGIGISGAIVNGITVGLEDRTSLEMVVSGIDRVAAGVRPQITGKRNQGREAGRGNLRQTDVGTGTNKGVVAAQGKHERLVDGYVHRVVAHATAGIAGNPYHDGRIVGGTHGKGIVVHPVAGAIVGPCIGIETAAVGNDNQSRVVGAHAKGVLASRVTYRDDTLARRSLLQLDEESIRQDAIGGGLHMQFIPVGHEVLFDPYGSIHIRLAELDRAAAEDEVEPAPFVIRLGSLQRGIVAHQRGRHPEERIFASHQRVARITNDAVDTALEDMEREAVLERTFVDTVHAQVEFHFTGGDVGGGRRINRMQRIGIDERTRAGSRPMRRTGRGHGITMHDEFLTCHDRIVRTGFQPGIGGLRSTLHVDAVRIILATILVLDGQAENGLVGKRLE